jgi:hypothetical protein
MAVGVITGRFDPSRSPDARVTMTFGSPHRHIFCRPTPPAKGAGEQQRFGEGGNENDSLR